MARALPVVGRPGADDMPPLAKERDRGACRAAIPAGASNAGFKDRPRGPLELFEEFRCYAGERDLGPSAPA